LPEASNTMTVTFVSNVEIDNAAWSNIIKLSISGLKGTATADNSALAVTDIENSGTATYFGNSGDWDQSSGTLVMTMPIFVSLPAATTLKFSFTLDNPATHQQAPTLSFTIVSTVLMYAGPMEIDRERVPAIPGAAAGDAVPLKVWSSFMCVKTISQSTPFPGALNTIAVSLSPTGTLTGAQNSKITIDGLLGAQTADGNLAITDVGGTNANILFGSTGVWTKATGKLVLSVANGQALGGGQMVSLTFQITNPAPKSPGQPILVTTSGTRVLGPERMAVQDRIAPFSSSTTLSQDVSGCAISSVYVASAAGISTGSVLQVDDELLSVRSVSGTNITVARAFGGTSLSHHVQGAAVYLIQPGCTIGDAVPLLVHARSLFSVSIGQSTSSPGQDNTITVTLALNSPLNTPSFSKITVQGLTGSATGSSNSISVLAISDVGSPSATTIFGGTGSWNQTAGSLVLALASGQSLSAGTPLAFSFVLKNPLLAQDAPSTSVTAQCVYSDAALYYTADGSQPSSASTLYSSAVAITTGQTLKAIAAYQEQLDSEAESGTYT